MLTAARARRRYVIRSWTLPPVPDTTLLRHAAATVVQAVHDAEAS
jgi:hypothetical protein